MRAELAHRHGIDGSGVLRQALRRWARDENITVSSAKKTPAKPAR